MSLYLRNRSCSFHLFDVCLVMPAGCGGFRSRHPAAEWTVTFENYDEPTATVRIFVTEAVMVVPFSCSFKNYRKTTKSCQERTVPLTLLFLLSLILSHVSCLPVGPAGG